MGGDGRNRVDDARQGGWVGGDFLEHLLWSLPGRFAEQAEFLGVEFENGAQRLWDGEDELAVADLFKPGSPKSDEAGIFRHLNPDYS
jgi:hypothetical protein